jgi:CRP/FNR family transcriptional regulator, cyclic AMP receptor protein
MNAESKTSFIESFPLFEVLSGAEKAELASMMELKSFYRYSFIYLPDDASSHLFFLAKGGVKIGTHSNDGKEIIKALIHPMAMFGEMGIVGQKSRSEFAQALKEDVQVYQLRVEDLKGLMRHNFDLCSSVINQIGNRLMKVETKLESLIFKDARTRIIDFIKEAVNKRGNRVGYEVLLKHSLTHQDIASITCTSRQTVTLVLNELKKSDLIHFNRGKILVRDIARLA